MRFTLDQVEVFVHICRTGSFSGAARVLGRSQSTVSTTIANLEIALNTELFDRGTRKPTLTPAGESLLIEAEELYDRSLNFERHGDSLSDGDPVDVTVAVAVPHALTKGIFKEFAHKFPHTNLKIRNPGQGNAAGMVHSGEATLGLALATPQYDDSLVFHQLGKIIMSHVVDARHPLAKIPRPSFNDLKLYRRIVYDAHARTLPTSEYLQSAKTWTADTYDALITLLSQGIGWASVPRVLVAPLIDSSRLVELYLEAYPHTDWILSVDLLWLQGRRLNSAELWLIEAFRDLKISEISPFGQSTTR